MHLLIDVQALQSPATRNRGIDRFARNLAAAMAAVRPGWHIELIQSDHLPPIDRVQLTALPLRSFRPPLRFDPSNPDANERYYADWLTAQEPGAILVPSFFDDQTVVPQFVGRRPPLFGVLHDLIPLLFHDHYLMESRDFHGYARRFRRLLAVDGVLANSAASANDLRALSGEQAPRIVTIGGAADTGFAPFPEPELRLRRAALQKKFALSRDFILYVGGFDFRKNMPGALRAFAALPNTDSRQVDLVIACQLNAAQRRELEETARALGIEDSLRLTGFVSDEELRALYQMCRVFFFPSLYEGLGFPVLEALRCGAPVVASDRSSVPEYAGGVSWLADPADTVVLARALQAALDEPPEARRAERMEHGRRFTWAQSAERACQALQSAPPRARAARPESSKGVARQRRRLAWVSPLPPAPSGIADYSAELLGHLSDSYEIELVVDPRDPQVAPELGATFTVLLGNEVGVRHQARPFDLFVVQLGNSHYHVYMLDLMRRFRCLAVLHDFYLGGLVLPAVEDGEWPATLAEELEFEGEPKLARALRSGAMTELEVLDHCPLNRRILAAAGAVIVHSTWAWQRVRGLVSVPVARVPQAAPVPLLKPGAQMRARLGLPLHAFIVATLGFVGPPKRIPSLFRAVAALPPATRQKLLVLVVGYAAKEVQEELLALAGQLGVASVVRFCGRVPLEDFAAYARAADVCVQLRYPTRGETSAALLRELAAGAVCVISDHGSIAEMPDGVVLKVRTPDHEVEDLTATLQRLYEHPEERTALREAAVNHVRRHHDIKQVVQRYQAMIELLIVHRQASDTLWTELACEALEGHKDAAAGKLMKAWATLRAHGQKLPGP